MYNKINLNISNEFHFKIWFKNYDYFKILNNFNCISEGASSYVYLSPFDDDVNSEPVDVYESINIYDKNGLELFYGCDIVKLVYYNGYESPSVCSVSHDVIDGRESTRYEYVGILLKDNFDNPYLYDIENDRILFYLINLNDCDKYEFEFLNTIYN